MLRYYEIHQRDDGLYDVISGETAAGPFPTLAFALRIASGEKPTATRNDVGGKFRRFRFVREVSFATPA